MVQLQDVKIDPAKYGKQVVDVFKKPVTRGDSVRFEALGTEAVVLIPNAREIFGLETPGDWLIGIVPDGGAWQTPPTTVTPPADRKGRTPLEPGKGYPYPYAVYCKASEGFAEGSSPVLLIEPP